MSRAGPSSRSESLEGWSSPPDGRQYRILVVEDDPLVQRTYRRVLSQARYQLLEASTIGQARQLLARDADVHAALVDFNLPDGTATELVQELIERRPLCRSAIVTAAADTQVAGEAARAGAHIYLRKPNTPPEILDAVARTLRSTLEWREALQHTMPAVGAGSEAPPAEIDLQRAVARLRWLGRLSPAATLVAWRLLWGDTNAQIAASLGCSPRTAKYHVGEVLARTGARNRGGLLRVLLEDAGQIDPWEDRLAAVDPDSGENGSDR